MHAMNSPRILVIKARHPGCVTSTSQRAFTLGVAASQKEYKRDPKCKSLF